MSESKREVFVSEWSERRWWHYIAPLSPLFIAFVAIMLSIVSKDLPKWVIASENYVIVSIGAFMISLCVWGCTFLDREFTCDSKKTGKIGALIDKRTGRIIKVGLQEIRCTPWPFRTQYKFDTYPTRFNFGCRLNPITTNPKVLPLLIELAVEARDGKSGTGSHALAKFAGRAEAAEKEFSQQAFEILQHRLPHALVAELNPFDPKKIEQLRRFVANELEKRLHFAHSVAIEVNMIKV